VCVVVFEVGEEGFFFFFLLLLSIVSVVVSVVCGWELCLWYCTPVFWLFVWCTFDMFRRWYYVVCMVCFFVLGVGTLLVCV